MATTLRWNMFGIQLLLIWTLFASFVSGQTFGYDGRYICHCGQNRICDRISGRCPNDICDRGWHGSICQQENVAIGENTFQSSYFRREWKSSNANDGNRDQQINHFGTPPGVCAHTRFDPYGILTAYWEVYLRSPFPINQIQIFYREGSFDRLQGFQLQLFLRGQYEKTCYTQTELPTTDIITVDCRGAVATAVRFYNERSRPITYSNPCVVELCELEVYVCALGTFGPDCSSLCYCENPSERCDYVTGQCTSGCAVGYQGESCTQRCSGEFYGRNCTNRCSDRHCSSSTSSCDYVTGACDTGCSPGYIGTDCIQECAEGSYGVNCSKVCTSRHCSNGSTSSCINIDGKCDKGCSPGYLDIDCVKECDNNRYGIDCKYSCNDRKCANMTDCPISDGRCTGICLDGYTSIDCMQAIVQEKEHANIGLHVGIGVAILLIGIVMCIIIFVIRRREQDALPTFETKKAVNSTITKKQVIGPTYENVKIMQKNTEDSPVVSVVQDNKSDMGSLNSLLDDDDHTYYNVDKDVTEDNSISIKDIGELVEDLKRNDSFQTIYKLLPSGYMAAFDVSQITENRRKNRYQGYYPYDYNRVILKKQGQDPYSDYINASYMDSYKAPNFFIAAQGATKTTLNNFIRMIFEKQCDKIVMLTNLYEGSKHKCEQYWPDEGSKLFGELELTLISEDARANYICRKIKINHQTTGKEHETMLFHFTAWADHGVPEVGDLLDYLHRVQEYKSDSKSPTLVHCSAGIGRSGAYIALDSLLKEGKATGRIDIKRCIITMRSQRKNMIQTASQLQFVYETLAYYFKQGKTSVSCKEYEAMSIHADTSCISVHLNPEMQLNEINSVQRNAESHKIFTPGKPDLQVFRTQSWKKKIGYIISDIKGHDMESLWNLITDQESRVAVFLLNHNKSIASFLPKAGKKTRVGSIRVSSTVETPEVEYTNMYTVNTKLEELIDNCKVLSVDLQEGFQLSQLQLPQLIDQIDTLDSTSDPVAVITSDMKHAAIFCIVRNILERIKLDNEVEIFNTTKKILQSLDGFFISQDEYNWLHKMAQDYISNTNVYENF
ncbi:hypothetical protein SNE40_004334 [Patella caerulea]|uniref:protein-tyrosine-phosphatase n=1 Tax=Patella caerulea TaxID=87958 RepID=A0AAN8K4J7_PATCE